MPARTWASSARAARARPRSAAASCGSSRPRAVRIALHAARRPRARSGALGRTRHARAVRREIRMVFQDPFASLNPRMTVGQIIGEPLLVNGSLSGAALDAARSPTCCDMVGLPAGGDGALPARLLRRPAPAHRHRPRHRPRAARHHRRRGRPRRSTSSLRTQILDLLLDLQERLDLSYIFISHDIGVIRYFCDRVAVMYRGTRRRDRRDRAGLHHPQHAYTKALLSAVPRPDPRERGIHKRHRYRGAP